MQWYTTRSGLPVLPVHCERILDGTDGPLDEKGREDKFDKLWLALFLSDAHMG